MIERKYSFKREYDPESQAYLYIFLSRSRNKSIPKAVLYSPRESDGDLYYNVGFGDLIIDPVTNEFVGLDDLTESNNGDMLAVFYTVVSTFDDFFKQHPNATLYFKGSTEQRSKVYSSLIARHWRHIMPLYTVWGIKKGNKEYFRPDVSYESVLFCKRK
jgi:hypothetical protein